MEDMLMDRDIWDAISRTKPQTTAQDVLGTMDQKSKDLTILYLADSILLNVHEQKIVKDLWKKLGDVYQDKSLVNKLF